MQKAKSFNNCQQCSNDFASWTCLEQKFCSKQCYWVNLKGRISPLRGRKCSDAHIEKNRISHIGQTPWHKGIKSPYSDESLLKMVQNRKKGYPRGILSPTWKGDGVGYDGLHKWVKRHLGRPRKCDFCATTEGRFFDWANRSREYKRDLTDWLRLCRKCHKNYDVKKILV